MAKRIIDIYGFRAVVEKINADIKNVRKVLATKADIDHTHIPADIKFTDGETLQDKVDNGSIGAQVDLTGYAKEEYVDSKIAALVDSAPETLDTLKELAEALQQNGDAVAALNEAIANKVDKEEGKVLIAESEVERLAGVDNYDDTEVKDRLDALEAVDHDAFLKAEDIVDLATKEEVAAKADADHVHNDLATKAELEEGLAGKADVDHTHEDLMNEYATIEELLAMYDEMQEEVPGTIEDVVTESAAAVNAPLVELKTNVYNQPAGTDVNTVDVSDMYITVALPEDEMYAIADKEIKDTPQVVKMSVGNNNFLTFEQYKFEGNELKLSIPTILLDNDAKFVVEATGYKDEEFAVEVPDMQAPVVEVKKHATFNVDEYNVVEVAEGEVNIELVSTVSAPAWAQTGMALLLFDFCDAEGNSLITDDSTFITKKVFSTGGQTLGMTGPDKMAAFGEEAKNYLAMYVPVKDEAYDMQYKAILIGADYKCMNVTIHVPANI